MVKVLFFGPITREDMVLDVDSLEQLSLELKKEPSLDKWLGSCAVAINDEIIIERECSLKYGDVVTLLPPVCGG